MIDHRIEELVGWTSLLKHLGNNYSNNRRDDDLRINILSDLTAFDRHLKWFPQLYSQCAPEG